MSIPENAICDPAPDVKECGRRQGAAITAAQSHSGRATRIQPDAEMFHETPPICWAVAAENGNLTNAETDLDSRF